MNDSAKQRRSQRTLIITLLTAFAMAAFFSWQSANASARRLSDAQTELAEAEKMTSDIHRLKNAPRIASLEMESPDEISNHVTAALRNLNSRGAKLQSLDPQQPIRIPKTEYQVRATDVELDNISIAELAKFSSSLVQSGQGLEVRDIKLTESQTRNPTAETWLARLTLTQVIYAPK